ncbi:Aste57867_23952 [Aphanomyces stellatus]|uniref:Deoxyribodipyrimidine photo-lyase n=1 Tax=Aphanomyces stellatus TaxID=120398 RepID=A0A485LNZ6_9STRA|nr:hypothetical protein As57867_023879 [Aphanomyces stellatus]VFU00595.1 Aste57867_23952 [Aphanomyces stellatus]
MRLRTADFALPGLRKERLQWLRGTETADGAHVLYWMQSSLRTKFNYALEVAVSAAARLQQPLHILHTIDPDVPSSERHMAFVLESVRDVHAALQSTRSLRLSVAHAVSLPTALAAARDASLVVVDHPYLRAGNHLCQTFAAQATSTSVLQVEGDVVVPVEAVSDKEEHAARTIRPKITKLLDKYLVPLPPTSTEGINLLATPLEKLHEMTHIAWLDMTQSVDELLEAMPHLDRSIPRVDTYIGGEVAAQAMLTLFLDKKLPKYDTARNEPGGDGASNLSPYLRHGNLSPVDIALQTKAKAGTGAALAASKASFLEELIVRRELSVNFVWFNPRYDTFEGALPKYALQTLADHAGDTRPHAYTAEVMEAGKTKDAYWNAAQLDMIATGKMQNYMRMYWGKKIIEWSATPEDAFASAIEWNDKYNLDGCDPNSYAGVAWVFGKHDQGWKEREIFGKVRYMNADGLERKFDMGAYLALVRKRCKAVGRDTGTSLAALPSKKKPPAKRKRV